MADPKVLDDYNTWHKNLSVTERQGNVLEKVWYRKTIENLPDLSNKKVLEIGCGRGEFSNFLHEKFPSAWITATDFSQGGVDVCKLKFVENEYLQFQVEDARSLSFESDSFDFVICCETLEHIPEVERAVLEIHRVLKKGGGFIITTPSYFNAYALVWLKCWLTNKPFESGQGVQPFEHFYTFLYVSRILRRSGLMIESSLSTHFQWLVMPRTDPAKLRTEEFKSRFLNRLFRPFGVHFFYKGIK